VSEAASGNMLHVMAGVLRDTRGKVLLAQRPAGKHLAGFWEFPGGKLEPGEAPLPALARELHEELGIHVEPQNGVPLIRLPWRYGERGLLLDAWQFTRWHGMVAPREGQALQWLLPGDVDLITLAPADRPILQALRLPPIYAITPAEVTPDQAEAWHRRIVQAIERGTRLIQLRLPLWPIEQVRHLAERLQPLAVSHQAQLLLNRDIDGARQLGAGVGVHVTAAQLDALQERPLPWSQLIGASCHDAAQLGVSVHMADFATLSPVAPTASHPDTPALGWPQFEVLAEASALPVYALGGMVPAQADEARKHGAQGVAGIRSFW
jgi:8-oxo-dGTP diphosphatase